MTPPGKPAHAQTFTPVNLLSEYMPPGVTGVPAPATSYGYNADRQLVTTLRPDTLLTTRTYVAGKLDQLQTPTGT